MAWYNFLKSNIKSVERDRGGNWFYTLINGATNNIDKLTETQRFRLIMQNPAALKVFKTNCDLFSLGRVETENSQLKKFFDNPNFYQSSSQFLWDYMFWRMLGTSYLRVTSRNLNDNTRGYFLEPHRIKWDNKVLEKLDGMTLTNQSYNELTRLTLEYCHTDGTNEFIPIRDLIINFDLSNGLGNWIKGNSAVDALYKIISNSDATLNAKGVNTKFTHEFMVTGQQNDKDTSFTGLQMSNEEVNSIQKSFLKNKTVHPTKSKIDIKRFVDDLNKLGLDSSYLADLELIGGMYSIPRELLGAESTYENQEKALFRHVEYAIKPSAKDFKDEFSKYFNINPDDWSISYDHLAFMQVVEKDRADGAKIKLDNLRMAQEMGILNESEVKEQGRLIFDYE